MTSYKKFEDVIISYRESEGATNYSLWQNGMVSNLEWPLLEALLSRSNRDNDTSQSGGLAKALDLWVAEELRALGFNESSIWPRLHKPRVLDPEISRFIDSLDSESKESCIRLLDCFAGSSANVLGSTYVKQVDVGMSSWMTGPEILISTKTMSSSFGKNLSNRFEEAYGDAKNLKGRHPLASIGFFFLVDSSIAAEEKTFMKAVAMLDKLQDERDVYDATCLLLFDKGSDGAITISGENGCIPQKLSAESFFQTIVDLTLKRSAPDSHEAVRRNALLKQ